MMRSKFSRLAVLGLAALSSQAFASVTVSGQVRTELDFISKPEHKRDTFHISRARLDVKGDVASDWVANIRVEQTSSTDKKSMIKRAYASWTGLPGSELQIGAARHLSAAAENSADHYQSASVLHGGEKDFALFGRNGVGASLRGSMGAFGYQLGLERADYTDQDPTDSEDTTLKLSWGGRASFVALDNDKWSVGLGLGYVSAHHNETYADMEPVAMNANPNNPPDAKLYRAKLNQEDGITLDIGAVMGNFAAHGAYSQQKDKIKNLMQWDTNNPQALTTTKYTADSNDPWAKDPKTKGYYGQLTYLLMGNGYHFKNGVVGKPKFSASALELGARFSSVERSGLTAYEYLVNQIPGKSFSALNHLVAMIAKDNALTYVPGASFKTKTTGMSAFVNYHVNPQAVVRVAFNNEETKVKDNYYKFADGTALDDDAKSSLAATEAKKKASSVKVRVDFNFS